MHTPLVKSKSTRLAIVWPYFSLVALILITYSPALFGGMIWDDDGAVANNPLLRTPEGLLRIWTDFQAMPLDGHWYPLVYTSFWFEFQMWGERPGGYHAINLALHAANALLLFRLLKIERLPGAWLVVAIWALHPLQVETVAWIYERKNTLSLFFCLLSFHAFVRHRDSRYVRWLLLSLLCFVLAMLSKTFSISLPVILGFWCWWKERRLSRVQLATIVTMAIVGAFLVLFDSYWVAKRSGGFDYGITFLQRVQLIGRILGFYALKFFWPSNLMVIYPRWNLAGNPVTVWLYLIVVCVALLVSFLVVLSGSRNARLRGAGTAMICFAAMLAPVSGLVDYNYFGSSFVSDHQMYHPSIWLAIMTGAGVTLLAQRTRMPALVQGAVASILLLALGVNSWRHAKLFQNVEVLFSDNLRLNPAAFKAHLVLGQEHLERNDLSGAERHFRSAVQLQPGYARSHGALGSSLVQLGRYGEARESLNRALELDASDASIHNDMGNLAIREENTTEALRHLEMANRLRPQHPEILVNYCIALSQAGRLKEAARLAEQGLTIRPDLWNLHAVMAELLLRLNSGQDSALRAEQHLREAINHGGRPPAQLWEMSGLAWIAHGNPRKAVEIFRLGSLAYPQNTGLRYNLARAYEADGSLTSAVSVYQEILKISPNHTNSLNNLAWILATADESSIRDGKLAVELSEKARTLTKDQSATIMDTAAAAYGESGNFEEARILARKAYDKAISQGDEAKAQRIQGRLKLYESGKPFRVILHAKQ